MASVHSKSATQDAIKFNEINESEEDNQEESKEENQKNQKIAQRLVYSDIENN